jgi:hypothetical protein
MNRLTKILRIKNLIKNGFAGILMGVSLLMVGCTEGTWYIGNKAITKDPETGKILTRKMNDRYERDANYTYDHNRRIGRDPYDGIEIPLFRIPVSTK